MKYLFLYILLVFAGCNANYVQDVISAQGSTICINEALFSFPDSAVTDSVIIEIAQNSVPKKQYMQGYTLKGTSFTVQPFELSLKKPIDFSIPVQSDNVCLGAKAGYGFVPCANSSVDAGTLHVQLWHGGEYYLVEKPKTYGIINHSNVTHALLIVTDPYVSDYPQKLSVYCAQNKYSYPVWVYVYDTKRSIEENAFFLQGELKKLHEQYGDFRLDIVSFGIGGLVFHRYVADRSLYLNDVSSAIIAVGTPFKGSDLCVLENTAKSGYQYPYFYIDALAGFAHDLTLESEFISWVIQNRYIVAGHYYKNIEENKNFASIRGTAHFPGELLEDTQGDGLVTLESGQLTAIEPDPLPLDHFGLFEERTAYTHIVEFVQLYHTFNWPSVFTEVWKNNASMTRIATIWEKEARLHYGDAGINALLQWNENMLTSAPQNAILVTNGDNDTYPAWYLQEQGVRTDITIVNRNLLNIKEYALYLQQTKSLPLHMSTEDLEKLDYKKEHGKIIMISDQLIKILVDNGEKPVVFSTTVYNPEAYGYPLTLVGVVYEIGEEGVQVKDKYVDVERTWQLFQDAFKFDKFIEAEQISVPIRNMYRNYMGSLFMLHTALLEKEYYSEALKVLEFSHTLKPDNDMRDMLYFAEAETYVEMNAQDKADSIFQRLIKMPNVRVDHLLFIAEHLHKWGRTKEAISILADCLKKEPNNTKVLELIEAFQEGL
jgi:hypothetical protein